MPKSVQLQTAEYATLFEVQLGASGWARSTEVVPQSRTSARRAIIGGREWNDSDRVAAVEFMLSDTGSLFSYGDHISRSYKQLSPSKDRTIKTYNFDREQILEVDLGDYQISIGLRPKIHSRSRDLIGAQHTVISIDFSTPVELTTAHHILFHVQIFCMLAIGRPCRRYGITVSSEPDFEQRDYSNCFSIYDVHQDQVSEAEVGEEPLFTCRTAVDRRRLKTALSVWMTRRDEWNLTYWLIYTFIQHSRFYDRERLIRAMAWFESLPDFQGQASFSDSKLRALKTAVAVLPEFKVLGLPKERLSTLAELRRSQLIDRLERAFRKMGQKYKKEVFSAELFDFCKLAKKYRDEAAHGGSGESVDNFPKLVMAISAIETLALACTLFALGVSEARMKRIANPSAGHPFACFGGFAVSARNREAEKH